MKKGFFAIALFAFTFSYANTTIEPNNEPVKVQVKPETYKVKVCMIKGKKGSIAIGNVSKSGMYDTETNKITIDGYTYRVELNSEFGKNGARGNYRYVAGEYYYFNL